MRSEIMSTFKTIIEINDEVFIRSEIAAKRPEHQRLGLTDSVLLELGKDNTTLLTSDLDLYLAAAQLDFDVINYRHIQSSRPDFS